MVGDKLAMLVHDPGGSFANNDEAHHPQPAEFAYRQGNPPCSFHQ
jgi:hypothetical protein